MTLDTAALRTAAAAFTRHAAAIEQHATVDPLVPADCPLAGRLHTPTVAAQAALRDRLRALAANLTETAAELTAAAGRATEADDISAAAFRVIGQRSGTSPGTPAP